MITPQTDSMDRAAKAVGELIDPLAEALDRMDLNLSALEPDAITAAMKMLGHCSEGTASEMRAIELIQADLAKHLACHLAKTAEWFDLNIRQSEDGGWFLDLWAKGGQVQRRTFATPAEARAAGDTLCDFLRLRGGCDYSYEIPASDHVGHEPELPF